MQSNSDDNFKHNYFTLNKVIFKFLTIIWKREMTNNYKSPTCDCCKKWVRYLERNGFDVKTKDMYNVQPVKKKMGVQQQYQSCHAAKTGNYFIVGLSAPGIPMGSPDMEGHHIDKYNVLTIDKNDNATIYSQY